MKIAMLTTENSACGIAEYSRQFVDEYRNLGHEVLVLGNPEYFGVYWFGEDSFFDAPGILAELVEFKPDVFHVQYQGSLYCVTEFNNMMNILYSSKLVPKTVVTIHDSSRGEHKLHLFDKIISHKDKIVFEVPLLAKSRKFPFPIPDMFPTVFSFGMGRNDYNFIRRVCEEIGISFDYHDGRVDGWISENDLFTRMKLADAIVLWYNEVPGIIGASSAARTALASYRPVITNVVSWFSDLDDDHYRCSLDEQELKEVLNKVLHLGYIRENSYRAIAERIIKEVYGG